jgi:APO RNA-binding
MKTCPGFKQLAKNLPHKWHQAQLTDILVPVETYHLMDPFQPEAINHDQRFDFTRIPAVLELCYQAGADLPENVFDMHSSHMVDQEDYFNLISSSLSMSGRNGCHQGNLCYQASTDFPEDMENQKQITSPPLSMREISSLANSTLEAWEMLRLGVKKLLLVYNAKVCRHCSEVHVGPSGHKVRTCGMYKFEEWRGAHMWKRAQLNDIVPENIVWHRRPQDPAVLEGSGRGFYGHAPAVVEICAQAGAKVPEKYFCMMKMHGLPPKI